MCERCPVCEGRGIVYGGFYQSVSGVGLTVSTTEQCRCCHGKGYVLTDDFTSQLAAAKARVEELEYKLMAQTETALQEKAKRGQAEDKLDKVVAIFMMSNVSPEAYRKVKAVLEEK